MLPCLRHRPILCRGFSNWATIWFTSLASSVEVAAAMSYHLASGLSMSPLMRLPPELRQLILRKISCSPSPLGSGVRLGPETAILRTCKKLYIEGQAPIYDNVIGCHIWVEVSVDTNAPIACATLHGRRYGISRPEAMPHALRENVSRLGINIHPYDSLVPSYTTNAVRIMTSAPKKTPAWRNITICFCYTTNPLPNLPPNRNCTNEPTTLPVRGPISPSRNTLTLFL